MKNSFQIITALSLIITLLSLVGSLACEAAPTTTPTVRITDPSAGIELAAGDITVSIDVSNFHMVDKFGQRAVRGEGHIHYYIDVEPPTTPGELAVTEPGTYDGTIETSYTWEKVTEGTHTLAVQLVNNDHTPLEPAVVDEVAVMVVPPGTIPEVTVNLTAEGLAFDKSEITVPSGAAVTINLKNSDSVQHNFALYETPTATNAIFVGEAITGPDAVTYQLTAPSAPGTYFFRCDLHPATMTGDFIVEEET
jgi:plastocyanin